MIATLFAAGLLLIPPANAFFRLPCAKPVLNSRVDPIISPGQPSSHSHTIMGSNAIGFSTTFQELRDPTVATCSTCKVKDDKSLYWTPELLYEFKNGTFQVVDHGGAIVYYLQRAGSTNSTVEAFPDGLRMFTGNPYARSDKGTPESKAISWLCLNFDEPGVPQTPGFTNVECKNNLRGQVFFPSCWNGVDLDSSDHKSHMAYPDGIDSGNCPSTHPRRLVSLFYELWFDVAKFNALGDGGRFVLSNGDPTGFGLHGDFMNGWDRDVLTRAVDTCTNLSGVIEDCPVFQNEGRFYTDDEDNACSAPNPLSEDDNSDVILKYLPGCVAISEGSGDATPGTLDPACVAANGGSAPASGVSSSAAPSSAPSSVSGALGSSSSAPSSASGVPSSAPAPTSSKAPSTDASASASTVSTPLPSGSSGPSGVSSHILLATDASSTPSAPPTTASPSVASAATSAAASSPVPSGTGNGDHCAKNMYRRDKTDAHRRSRMKRTHRSPLSK